VNFCQGTLLWQPILWHEKATSWHTPSVLFVLAFYRGWEYRNADCCINVDDDSSKSGKYFVSVGPVTPEILLRILHGWMGAHMAKIRCALEHEGHLLGGSSMAIL